MRGFIISIALLLTVLALVIINAIYINKTIDRMTEIADDVKANTSEEAINELYEYWETHRYFVALSVSLREIDSVTENLLNLKTACAEKNSWLINQSYSLFINSLEDIRRYEELSSLALF